ncbi:glycerol-3-phosphate dehydrogenase [Gluconobacter kanchanaburiensis]|uniref:Glycerol-3-phosphate dehydrogenase n=1 Tax=Gluconobacter kanchanaburiensis NBRC 103587 TaxID=1307948 RepID=A0A511B798_9PROT|nr:glycerol-3-phosphate dehydrogenase [Gluconobacter kanchanaburiensis]MBF0860527.1 glycerol-3-phosphate dehydrogenase [Gluconobacter kanchanaburiensis]GBR69292.1 glycerol-3-phosphate dehydrogenase [Gluconobacter kanchanaburiensis NBRC 103587]GEK96224.1 glycerol-3-phosphate dehydrogenase [Gluconobacter kanchanaburiensis NBRC 103587]
MSSIHEVSSVSGSAAPYDLLVVGGGINGCGIARDAAGRGAKVLLVEQDDLASHTSSASTKLIHGGLRYLEYYEFRLVREALMERERLLKIAPHIIWPMRFVLPHSKMLRPAWLLRTGLFLYDHLCPNMTLPRTKALNLRSAPAGRSLRSDYVRGFEYSDGWVQDSRLVVLNAMDAVRVGATVKTRTRLVKAVRAAQGWTATIEDTVTGEQSTVEAKAVVNAAGPWVAELLQDRLNVPSRNRVRLVKGSHIVVPRVFEGSQAYIFQNPDKRIVFAIPYEQDFTLIGTTDVPWEQDPAHVEISQDEITYLCESVNRYFTKTVRPEDVVWTYAGVRPLYDDNSGNASAVTRDYVLDVDATSAPILSVFGGKITTFRKLAEHAVEKLAPHLPVLRKAGWTDGTPLPGGEFAPTDFDSQLQRFRAYAPHLSERSSWRLLRNYGLRAYDIATPDSDRMGRMFGKTLSAREVDYLIDNEWARSAEDILWRRSRLGLFVTDADRADLQTYVESRLQASPSSVSDPGPVTRQNVA